MSVRFTTNDTISQFKEKHGDRFDYSKWIYGGRKRDMGIITCKLHGDFETCRMDHLRLKDGGCPDCSGVPKGGRKLKNEENVLKILKSKHPNLDFSEFRYINNTTKSTVICPIHGEFEKDSKHLLKGQGCPICSGKRKRNLPSIQQQLNDIHKHEKYKVVSDVYINNKTPIKIECEEHGVWEARVDNLISSETRCPKCAACFSKSELEVFEYMKSLDNDVLLGDRTILKNRKQIDTYSSKHSLGVEFNGLYHHAETSKHGKENKEYHLQKTNECLELGITLLHIFEDEWKDPVKQDIWKSMIAHRMGKTTDKIYGRNCEIREVSVSEASTFLNLNHLQGFRGCKVNLGLYFKGSLVAVLSMGASRFDKSYDWEIIRYSNRKYSFVMGGFQKLFKFFIKNYNPKSIVTYADRRYSEGNMYSLFGMVESENKHLNYFYFDKHKLERLPRYRCQKHLLHKMLPNFDDRKSEKQNMMDHGFDIIWDCGNKKFTWKPE